MEMLSWCNPFTSNTGDRERRSDVHFYYLRFIRFMMKKFTTRAFWVSSLGAVLMMAQPGLMLAASMEEGEMQRKTGTVVSVDAVAKSFVFEDRNDNSMTVFVQSFTVFTRTGDLPSDFDSLQTEDRIYVWGVTREDGALDAYEVHNRSIIPGNIPSNSEIRSIDVTNSQITTGTGSKERTVQVTDATQIILGPNEKVTLADLQVGDIVQTGYGPRRKDDPIEAVRLIVTRDNLVTTHLFIEGEVASMVGDQFPYALTINVSSGSTSDTLEVKISVDSTVFNKQYVPSEVGELMTGDRVEFWMNPETTEVDWMRNLSLKTVSTKGIMGTIVDKDVEKNTLSVAWVGGVYEVAITGETDIIVRKDRNATMEDLLIGMAIRARGEKQEGEPLITASMIVVPTGTQAHKAGQGTGVVRYNGTGQAVFTGNGTVEAWGKKGTVIVRDLQGDAKVETNGTGSTLQLDASTWKYRGYGSIEVSGSDVVVLLEGVGVRGVAEGTGTYTLTGKGTYRTSGRKAQSIPTAGIVLTTLPAVNTL